MKKLGYLVLILGVTFIRTYAQSEPNTFTNSIEKAHKKQQFLSKKVLSYDIAVMFGGKNHLEAKVTQTVGGDKIKIEKSNGATILFDGNEVYATGISKEKLGGARFDIFTWPYFTNLPYKLNDKGTVWSNFETKPFYKKTFNTGKLSFTAGTGDAPDDWYIIYQNPTTKIVEGAAYIVSFGKGKEAAEKEPHAVKFNEFKSVSNIPIPVSWTFHLWTDKEGYGTQVGDVSLKNVLFLDEANFSKPENATKVVAP